MSLHLSIVILFVFVELAVGWGLTLSFAKATNEGSYMYGYWQGSLTGPQFAPGSNWNPELDNNTCHIAPSSTLDNPKGAVIPAVTNKTACEDGFYNGYKNWCINHAVDCVENITIGDYPDMIMKAHQEYLRGSNAANGSGNSMCPIGENTAFCTGWDGNNDDYGNWDCGDAYDNYTGPFSSNLVGCPLDTLNPNQMAKPHMLVGTWHYLNESSMGLGSTSTISGKIVYSDYGNFTLTVPNHSGFGDYTLEGRGYQGHNILTECYAGGHENNTLTTVTPNHIEFTDNHGDTIHLMRVNTSAQLQLPLNLSFKGMSVRL